MAVLTDAYVAIGGTDYSAYVQSIDFPIEFEEVDDTAMGNDFRSVDLGLEGWTTTIVFHQDISNVDANIWTAFKAKSEVSLEVRQTTDAVSSSNPKITATAKIKSYQPYAQSVGDQHTVTVSLVARSTTSRSTSA